MGWFSSAPHGSKKEKKAEKRLIRKTPRKRRKAVKDAIKTEKHRRMFGYYD